MLKRKSVLFIMCLALILLTNCIIIQNNTRLFQYKNENLFTNFNNKECSSYQNSLAELQSMDIEDIASMQTYNSKDYNIVTNVKDQGSSNLCWAYASASAAETSILRSGIDSNVNAENLSLSPRNIGYARFNRGADPLNNNSAIVGSENWLTSAGTPNYAAEMFAMWCGPTDNSTNATADQFINGKYRLINAEHIDTDNIKEIKRAIAKYGAITFGYNNLREVEYYNPKNETSSNSYPHAVTLIGWDDNIPANKFVPNGASQNGGWIVKNSYNSLPYFYLSYDNKNSAKYGFEFVTKDTYDNNYFYDGRLGTALSSSISSRHTKFANIFEAKKGESGTAEYLKSVNIGIASKKAKIRVEIYTNLTNDTEPESGTLSGVGRGYFDYGGNRTIKLDNPVRLDKGSKFSVVVCNEDTTQLTLSFVAGGKTSYKYKDYWVGTSNNTARIKAFTTSEVLDSAVDTDITNAEIKIIGEKFIYSGLEIKPKVSVTLNGNRLTEQDYSIAYTNNINAGMANIKISGTGEYFGEKSLQFKIEKADIPPLQPNKEINVESNIIKLTEVELPKGWHWINGDYNLDYGSNNVIAEYFDKINYNIYTINVVVNRKEVIMPPTEPVEPEPPIVEPEPIEPPIVEPQPDPPLDSVEPSLPSEPIIPEQTTPDSNSSFENNSRNNNKLLWLLTIPASISVILILLVICKVKRLI